MRVEGLTSQQGAGSSTFTRSLRQRSGLGHHQGQRKLSGAFQNTTNYNSLLFLLGDFIKPVTICIHILRDPYSAEIPVALRAFSPLHTGSVLTR